MENGPKRMLGKVRMELGIEQMYAIAHTLEGKPLE